MKMRPLGLTGLNVSEVGFGALEIGRDWAPDVNADPSHPDAAEAGRVLNGVLDRGINFIDTAPAYWYSEEFIGSSIAHRRAEFVLATKVGEHCDPSGSVYDYSGEATLRFVDQSLRRLRTDRIDLLQIHSASVEVLERGETLQAMEEARRTGKALHLGMTGGVDECVRAIELGGYETVQVPYNLLNSAAAARLLPLARERGVGVIIMRGLAGGKLTPKYRRLDDGALRSAVEGFDHLAASDPSIDGLDHLAVAFALAPPEVSSVIFGTRRLEAVDRNIALADKPVPTAILARAAELSQTCGGLGW